MGLLDSADVDYIRKCLEDIASDVEESLTYKQYTDTKAGNPVIGTPDTYSYTDRAITAGVHELTLEEVQKSGGAYLLGDMEFSIRQNALAFNPGYPDRIVYAGTTFKPRSINHGYLGELICWKIIAGKQ